MGKRLFVGNLPYSTGDVELRTEFAKVGQVVDAKVITNRDTGTSRGIGFVEFATEAEAANAIQALDGISFGGRKLVVKEAEDRRPGGRPSGGAPPRFSAPSPQYGQGERESSGGNGAGRGGRPKKKGGSRRRRDDDYDWGG